MGMIRKNLAAMATALAVTLTGLTPAQAMPFASVPQVADRAPVTDVQFSQERGDQQRLPWVRGRIGGGDRWDRGDRRWNNRHFARDGYYNGHRGYRERRSGYRYHNGFWFPLAAFGAGALIGGAVSSAPRASYGNSHVSWCEQRYKTYRASDNTYVANSRGERRICNSPY